MIRAMHGHRLRYVPKYSCTYVFRIQNTHALCSQALFICILHDVVLLYICAIIYFLLCVVTDIMPFDMMRACTVLNDYHPYYMLHSDICIGDSSHVY